jgi:hypothetical protein
MANEIKIDKSEMLTVLLGVGGGIVLASIVGVILYKAVLPKIAPKYFPEGSSMNIAVS